MPFFLLFEYEVFRDVTTSCKFVFFSLQTLKHYFADVEKLSEAMGKQLWLILQRALISVRQEPTIIVTVVRIIEREERLAISLFGFASLLVIRKAKP